MTKKAAVPEDDFGSGCMVGAFMATIATALVAAFMHSCSTTSPSAPAVASSAPALKRWTKVDETPLAWPTTEVAWTVVPGGRLYVSGSGALAFVPDVAAEASTR